MAGRALIIAACLSALVAGPGTAYDYRTLHLIEDRHTHAIIRVSAVPEGGDLPERGRADCAGVDALDRRGRNIARAFGRAFQRSSIHIDLIYTSNVCRQIEAGRLLEIGPSNELDLLDPIEKGEDAADRMDALLTLLDGLPPGETALLIAHQATVEALLGETLAVGEGLVFTLPPFGRPELRGRFGLPPH